MRIDDLIEEAEALEASGGLTDAILRLREAIAIERRPEWLATLGALGTRVGNVDEAEELLLEAIGIAPQLSDAHFYLGFLSKKKDQLELAKDSLERALELEEWEPGLTVIGEVYRQLDMPVEALRAFERATLVDPSDSEAWYGVGLIHRFDDSAKALAAFRQSVAVDAAHGAAHRELGHMQMRTREFDRAEQSLITAVRLNDEDFWAHDYLGNLLLLTNRPDEAERSFRRAIALWPDVPLFHINLGDALRALGQIVEAERAYTQALSLDIGNYLPNLRMGEVLLERGKLTSAQVYLERALQAKPNERRALRALDRIRDSGPTKGPPSQQ